MAVSAAPYTVAQYNAIRAAYATGVLLVMHEGRRTEFRSREDMRRIIGEMAQELGIDDTTTPAIRRLRVVGTKGL